MEVLLQFSGHNSSVVKMIKLGCTEVLATVSETGELACWDLRFAHDLISDVDVQRTASNSTDQSDSRCKQCKGV